MYVKVLIKMPLGVNDIYTYSLPDNLKGSSLIGKRVEVDFIGKKTVALCVEETEEEPTFETKDINKVLDEEPIFTQDLYNLSLWAADYYVESTSNVVYSILSLKDAKIEKYYEIENNNQEKKDITLNTEQQSAIDTINKGDDKFFYLWGITGSGKTKVYIEVIKDVINSGKTAIYLVPEIGLTYELIQEIISNFSKEKVAVLHSGLTKSQKLREWRRIINKEAVVVLGARSAVFAPLSNIGVIIIDEEHDSSYKSSSQLCYNTRTVAYKRALMHGCKLVMGSATPSLEAYKTFNNSFKLLTLTKRAVSTSYTPNIALVDSSGSPSVISKELKQAIQNTLDENKQVMLFLNKRGYLYKQMCQYCGWIYKCPHCDVALTYFKDKNILVCPICSHKFEKKDYCDNCHSPTTLYQGYGVQLVCEEIQKMFPSAKMLRLDSDVTALSKNSFKEITDKFRNKEADILVGTQMIAKGLNFPHLKLVGVINALSGYSFVDFRQDEKLFSLLLQVVGRAGRFMKNSSVIIQSENTSMLPITCVVNNNIEKFYQEEFENRKDLSLPPFTHYARVLFSGKNENKVSDLNKKFQSLFSSQKNITIEESGVCAYSKIKDDYRYHTLLSSEKSNILSQYIKKAILYLDVSKVLGVRVKIDMDPQDLY